MCSGLTARQVQHSTMIWKKMAAVSQALIFPPEFDVLLFDFFPKFWSHLLNKWSEAKTWWSV